MLIKKCFSTIILSILLVGIWGNIQVGAALTRGSFLPLCSSQAVTTESKVEYYEIKKGDTLWDISKKFKIDLNTILVMNNIKANSILSIGQVLEIPYERARIHTIARGETMWDIAVKYGADVNQLVKANPNKNPRYLTIGDKLNIPDSSSTPRVIAYNEVSRSFSPTGTHFMWPVVGTITSRYGYRGSGFHHGLDIAGRIGEPIKASMAGTVIFADYKSVYGRTVVLQHLDGYETVYAHLQNINVSPGKQVAKGEVIGTIGTTGRTTGPHVHFEVKKDTKNLDPLTCLR
ncbi:MAG TPA: M23 family metallopeptidase [Syntrophomonadaceae bacterium]|nr:M23 family metallopeptidase [Syntrophomonadaceae bacterium]